MLRLLSVIILASPSSAAVAGLPKPGVSLAITRTVDTAYRKGADSQGSSHDRDVLVERVIAVSDTGVDIEYDLPTTATAEERAGTWFFPVRVRRRPDGTSSLLNRDELEARVDPWLKSGNMTRAACGRLIFTWNAFRIECDPATALNEVALFDMGMEPVQERNLYRDPSAKAPVALARGKSGSEGATFTATLALDPVAVREQGAATDVAVGELTKRPVTIDAAKRHGRPSRSRGRSS